MDIDGLTSAYSDIYKSSSQSASKLENQLKTDYSKATEDELLGACKQFEAYFVEQMFKAMVKTIPTNESLSGSSANMLDYYKDEMIQKLAADSTEQNSLGLAQMLYEQMRRNYGLDENIAESI